ncbi:MAG: DedA family protein [Campylobacteraceae bacterium]|nr:DedA family protein [Campylobacteraceae bacterium]
MEEIINNLSIYGYLILFFYSLSGGIVALVAAGILSSQGSMNIWICIATAMAANITGDAILVWLSRYNKSAVMPYIKKHRRKLALSHLLIKRQGAKIIIMQKFIYGLKTLVPLAIGFTKYPLLKFNSISVIGACLWAFVMGFGSYYAGTYFTKFFAVFSDKPYMAPVILLIFAGLVWTYFTLATKKDKTPR